MDDTLDVRPGCVDGCMELEACHIHSKVGGSLLYHGPLHINLYQTTGSDLVV